MNIIRTAAYERLAQSWGPDVSNPNRQPAYPAPVPGTQRQKPQQMTGCTVTLMGQTLDISSATTSVSLQLTPQQVQILLPDFSS